MAGPPASDDRTVARLTAVAALGFLLLVPPLVALFDRGARVAGVPVICLYLFGVWAGIICLVAVVVRRMD